MPGYFFAMLNDAIQDRYRLVVRLFDQMDICVQRNLDAGMAENLGDGLDISSVCEKQAGKGMAQ